MNILDRIHLSPNVDTSLSQQLKQQLNWFIASGQLQPGEFLPSLREVSHHFSIHANTVRSAYQKLAAEGLVETRQGKGTRILPFDPHRMAQLAGSHPSHTVGVILPSLGNPFYQTFLEGIEAVARPARTMLFLCLMHDDPGEALRFYAQLAAKNVDGLILASIDDSMLPTTRPRQVLPLVSVDWPPTRGYSVGLDLENAGYLATRHLLEHGHRRVGLITYAVELQNVKPVNSGYYRALQEAGIPGDPAWIAAVPGFGLAAGEEGARQLLAMDEPPSAVFAVCDTLAIGAMRAIQQAGLRIPQEVAIAGFNDIPLASVVTPPLTTVHAPTFLMGQAAMSLLQSLIAGKQPRHRQVLLPTHLVIRESCGEH